MTSTYSLNFRQMALGLEKKTSTVGLNIETSKAKVLSLTHSSIPIYIYRQNYNSLVQLDVERLPPKMAISKTSRNGEIDGERWYKNIIATL